MYNEARKTYTYLDDTARKRTYLDGSGEYYVDRDDRYLGVAMRYVVICDLAAPFEVVCYSMKYREALRKAIATENPDWVLAIYAAERRDGTVAEGTLYRTE